MTTKINSLFSKLPKETATILEDFDLLLQSIKPLSSKQLSQLPEKIRELSHILTDERSRRRSGYLNETANISAYMRYYQWWNLVRLTKLFLGLPSSGFNLQNGNICVDVGSGPLTLPIALWLARPDLREKKLTWYCIDYSHTALALGEDIYLSIVARTAQTTTAQIEPWKIVRVRGELGVSLKARADLIVAANVFNEIVEVSQKPPEYTAKKTIEILTQYAKKDAKILIIEPGTPPSVRFLTALKNALFKKNYQALAPCPALMELAGNGDSAKVHCPMDGSRGNKWCHFVFSTEDAPKKLLKLSHAAHLAKERASLSFVFAIPQTESSHKKKDIQTNTIELRIISDPISLPKGRIGYYACSKEGLSLAVSYSEKTTLKLYSGDLILTNTPKQVKIDYKSVARLIPID